MASVPNLKPLEDSLHADEATVKKVLTSWGPGKFDAELDLDGKAFRPDGKASATLIPPAFGLAGVNLHTWGGGWGTISYWNAYVANLELNGQGNFLDDLVLPGMLHMAILRAPLAHARVRSIDTSAAAAVDGVIAVVTGELMAQHNLAWMPTLSYDTQAVLATDKVRFQGQEVAFVVAQDRYSARDALELIHVEYEPLPAVADAQRALEPGAAVIRDDLPDRTTGVGDMVLLPSAGSALSVASPGNAHG